MYKINYYPHEINSGGTCVTFNYRKYMQNNKKGQVQTNPNTSINK